MVRRSRDQICHDIIRACPGTITTITRGANLSYYRAIELTEKMIGDGLIETRVEDPRRYGVNRRTPTTIYHITPKGRKLLEAKH